MLMNTNTSKVVAAVFRWTARILGAVLVFFVGTIAIGEGMPNPLTQPFGVQMGFLGLGLILAGMVAGWVWERAGGWVSLSGWGMFLVAVARSPRGLTWFVWCLAIPGALFLASAILRRRAKACAHTP